MAVVGDTMGSLNSLFTGLALAAIVIAIFVQAEQLNQQVETNKLYKQEVDATLRRLVQENAWKSVESKMGLIPIISEVTEKELMRLIHDLQITPLAKEKFSELYKSSERISRIRMGIDSHEQDLIQQKEKLGALYSTKRVDQNKLLESIKEFDSENLGLQGLQQSYVDAMFNNKGELDKLTKDIENVSESLNLINNSKIRETLSKLDKLRDEYSLAFDRAYRMTDQI
jgi:hypothetical protein